MMRIVKGKSPKGITLIALVITIIVLLILAGISIAALFGDNGLITKAMEAKEQTEIKAYYEKIEMIRTELRLQKENYEPPTLVELKEEFDTNQSKWVAETKIEEVEGKETLILTTKEGYIFYITETGTEYKGKGKVVDTSALKREDALKLEIVGETARGRNVQITDLSGEEYYKIEYQIDSTEGEWTEIENEGTVEVAYSSTIHARLTYGPNKGVIISLSIETSNPEITAKSTDTSNVVRKTEKPFADLFEITWGSDGTGSVEYSIAGNLDYKNISVTNVSENNLSALEIGTYNVNCKITSPSNKTVNATKQVKVTELANVTVVNNNNQMVTGKGIYSMYDLAFFRDLVNGGDKFEGRYVNQKADINLNSEDWTPIGNETNYFAGIYDGENHTTENLKVNQTSGYDHGLFGYVNGKEASYAEIKNLIVKGKVTGTCNVGGIIGRTNYTTVKNCTNYAEVVSRKSVTDVPLDISATGGILGRGGLNVNNIENCRNYGSITGNYMGIGGIVGWMRSGTITESKNYADINNNVERVGGIVGAGLIDSAENRTLTINQCINQGKIKGKCDVGGIVGSSNFITINGSENKENATIEAIGSRIDYDWDVQRDYSYVGGIIGCLGTNGDNNTINGCKNRGNVKGGACAVGGIAGSANKAKNIQNCINGAKIEGNIFVGGICGNVGYNRNGGFQGNGSVLKCKNTGEISSFRNVGGIVGQLRPNGKIEQSCNTGKITSTGENDNTSATGGIVGAASINSNILYCYNIGEIEANFRANGGIVGWAYYVTSIRYCYNIGSITNHADYYFRKDRRNCWNERSRCNNYS